MRRAPDGDLVSADVDAAHLWAWLLHMCSALILLEWHEVNGKLFVRPRRVTLEQVRLEMRAMVGPRKRSLLELKEARGAAVLEKYRRARG